MEIIKSSVLGFCFGVKNAVEQTEKALSENNGKNVYSLGPLIHNENFLSEMKKKGLIIADDDKIEEIPNGAVVIIRAHGVEPKIINRLEEKKCRIINSTCPRVKASQKMVKVYSSKNEKIIFTGDKNHEEVISIAAYAKNNFYQIQNYDEAVAFLKNISMDEKIILMSQTTFSPVEFSKIKEKFIHHFKNLEIKNTICPATEERQKALIELCKKVDGVLVIGGSSSANTKRLYQTALENCKNAAYIQSPSDIPKEFFLLEKVGITAGASTPDKIIRLVEKTLQNMIY